MNSKYVKTMILLSVVVIALIGCGDKKYEPVAVNEDVDKCDICNMQVNDNGFATQLITEEGKVYKFDDLGCMNEWKKENGTDEIEIEFVRDQETSEWINADRAYYAYDPSFKSPMAYGLISFKDKKSAEQYIVEQGTGVLMNWSDLSSHTWERNKGNMHMQMKNHEEKAHEESEAMGSH
ncbi:MAG: nitrous oxide reductase accessory protein NosL [Paenibacillaceae bacterium]